MSYEYIRGLATDEEEEAFRLGVRAAPLRPARQRPASDEQQVQRPGLTTEDAREACGGVPCPEGLKRRAHGVIIDPIRLTEFKENMSVQGCSLLCAVGNSHTYCCPSAVEIQEVVADPFAVDPITLDIAAASIATTPTTTSTTVVSAEDDKSARTGLVALLGILSIGAIGIIGFVVSKRKRKKKKGKRRS